MAKRLEQISYIASGNKGEKIKSMSSQSVIKIKWTTPATSVSI